MQSRTSSSPARKPPARRAAIALLALAAFAPAAAPAPAAAVEASPSVGGFRFFETPAIDRVKCVRRCAPKRRVQAGSTVKVRGRSLSEVIAATFLGGPSDSDDVDTRVRRRGPRAAVLRVPRKAVSGPLSLRTDGEVESPPSDPIDILPPVPSDVLAGTTHVFPVRGKHDYGSSGARFGSGRSGHSHQGQDVFARCGTPLVAARGGTVQFRDYHAAAGHYVVIDNDGTRADYAYMHLQSATPFRKGEEVATGQRIGSVGDSGNARGCHLHFEIWSSPGWYEGGRPIDPYRALKAWDRATASRRKRS